MTEPQPFRAPLAALTGATGFLGSHIADVLIAQGWRVRAAVRPTSDRSWLPNGVTVVEVPIAPEGDIDAWTSPEERRTLTDFVRGASAVIHCAGAVRAESLGEYRRANTASTWRLLNAARDARLRGSFVLISSLAAAGPSAIDRPRLETGPRRPVTDYGRSKAEAEALVEQGWPFRTAILRPPALYGPRDEAFLPLFKAARRGLTIRIGNLREVSLVDGRDAAEAAVLLAADDRARGIYFVDDGADYDFADLAEAVGEAWNRKVRTLSLPQPLLEIAAKLVGRRRASRLPLLAADRLRDTAQEAWTCDGSRLRDQLGFEAEHDLFSGFIDTLAWYRREGWL